MAADSHACRDRSQRKIAQTLRCIDRRGAQRIKATELLAGKPTRRCRKRAATPTSKLLQRKRMSKSSTRNNNAGDAPRRLISTILFQKYQWDWYAGPITTNVFNVSNSSGPKNTLNLRQTRPFPLCLLNRILGTAQFGKQFCLLECIFKALTSRLIKQLWLPLCRLNEWATRRSF